MKAEQKLSGNDLSELLSLLCNIQHEIDKYSHVSDFLPKPLKDGITNYQEKLGKEFDRREDLM